MHSTSFQHNTTTAPRVRNILTMATGVDAKLLKSTKFPPEFSQKVDMEKVNLEVMKKFVEDPQPCITPTRLTTSTLADGLLAKYQRSLVTKTMW